MNASLAGRAIDAVWRIESPRLIAALTRLSRDVAVAEDLAQDALVAALEQWPVSGVPANPGAWLMAVAKRRAVDRFRREELGARKRDEFGRVELARKDAACGFDESLDDDVGDDLLRLVFIACHPVLSRQARVALTLRLIGGLSTVEIARAYFASEATIAQRIVRAKRTLTEAQVPFEMPQGHDRAGRLASVLEVLYLIFNEGYCATAGDDWLRPSLCEDALRMSRVVAELMPREAEVHGLVALLEIQASRTAARIGPTGEPVLLLDQDRSRWNRLLIRRGFAALDRSERLGGSLGLYALQAAIAACHARARIAEETDWVRVAALYDALLEVMPSPVVALNRAVAVGFGYGPAAGLEAVEELRFEKSLDGYYLLASVRGDLLARPRARRRGRVRVPACRRGDGECAGAHPLARARKGCRRCRLRDSPFDAIVAGDLRHENSCDHDPPTHSSPRAEPGRDRPDRRPHVRNWRAIVRSLRRGAPGPVCLR